MRYVFILVILSFWGTSLFAQKSYWQQKVDNDISVTLDDEEHMLRGHISIRYYNNAPDTLKFIYFHLYPNAYSNDRTAYEQQAVENRNTDHYFSDEEDRGFIDSLKFRVSMNEVDQIDAGILTTKDADIVRLILPEPLLPGQSARIETDFRVKIPLTFSRLGHQKQAYQISQWFPKPAVYDATGWHPIPYLDQGEFYSEYGSYTVAVTLPANYIVMGTGNIQEETEIAWLDSLAASTIGDSTEVSRSRRLDTTNIMSSKEKKTITFKEENIHDFAWFADKRWLVKKDTVALLDSSATITSYACYLPHHTRGWQNSMASVKATIRAYSDKVGNYPYRTVKVVDGDLKAGGGMEYPTVTVIAAGNEEKDVHNTIVHEVGHNWFYGILGSNERKYPWMDEGINSFYEINITPPSPMLKTFGHKGDNFFAYSCLSATHELLPADTAADLYPNLNYGVDISAKTPQLMQWLEAYMGKEQFDNAMKEYYTTWKFKHPQPADFEVIFRNHSEKNLDWFFKEVMKSNMPVDFALRSVKRNQDHISVALKNKTGLLAPVPVILYKTAQDSITLWTAPFRETAQLDFNYSGPYEKVMIADVVPDFNLRNNSDKRAFKLKPFLGINMDPVTKFWLSPAIGYNRYDGFMAGLLLHNLTLPQNKFQFALVPLYSFGSKTLNGTGRMSYTVFKDHGWLHDLEFFIEGKTFSFNKNNLNIPNYLYNRMIKVVPGVTLNFRKPYWRSEMERSLTLKAYWIREDFLTFNQNPVDSLYRPSKGGYEDNFYGLVRYVYQNKRTFNSYGYTLEAQGGEHFAKLSAEINLKIDYYLKNKGLYIRAYAGKFFSFNGDDRASYRYRLANTYSGQNDYLYDETYLGRSERSGFYSQQISMKEGGFKINTLQYASQLGFSDNWLFALNLKTDLPLWNLPIRLFADVGTYSNIKQNSPSGAGILYEAGIEVYISNYLSIYLPLVMSKDFNDYTKSIYSENRFLKTISFSLNLGNLNWSKLPSQIMKM